MEHNLIIIGSGPAGLTAGIYAARSKLKPLIIEGNQPGGQLISTSAVENWPGEISIQGPELIKKIRTHAESCGAEFISDFVDRVDFSKVPYELYTKTGKRFKAKSVIISTGSSFRKLGVPGEKEYWGSGVSVCAVCDAPFYEGKEVIVVGGGNSAITEAYALSQHATKVTILQVGEQLTARDPLVDDVKKNPKIEILLNVSVKEITGDGTKMTGVIATRKDSGKEIFIKADGVFVAIGLIPNSSLFEGQVELDERGYIVRSESFQTSISGVFAVGDVADKKYRQAITAAGEGCAAALECDEHLRRSKIQKP